MQRNVKKYLLLSLLLNIILACSLAWSLSSLANHYDLAKSSMCYILDDDVRLHAAQSFRRMALDIRNYLYYSNLSYDDLIRRYNFYWGIVYSSLTHVSSMLPYARSMKILDISSQTIEDLSSSLIMLIWCFSDLREALNPTLLHNATKVNDLLKWMDELHDVLCLLGYRFQYEVQGEKVVELYNISTLLPSYEDLASKIEDLALQGYQILKG